MNSQEHVGTATAKIKSKPIEPENHQSHCLLCGQHGHETWDCSELTGKRQVCPNCDSPTHQAEECPYKPFPPQGTFGEFASKTLKEAKAIFEERGTQYADTWGTCRFLTMQAVARALRCEINLNYFRALATAALIDMKHERLAGGYDVDHLLDGINYSAFLVEEMRRLNKEATLK